MAPNPVSAADSLWKLIAYSKATLSVATAAWEGHRLGAFKPPPSPDSITTTHQV